MSQKLYGNTLKWLQISRGNIVTKISDSNIALCQLACHIKVAEFDLL